MTKKLLACLLALLMAIAFMGCNKNKTGNSQKDEIPEESEYSDDRVLFAAQDRCDVEDDRTNVYSYNYKGELLDSSDSSGYIGYYAKNGLAPAVDQSTGKVGFVDKDGVFQIEPIYKDAAPFSDDGIALVKIDTEESDYKCGYINSKGEEIFPCIYDNATSFFNCGYALAIQERSTTDKYGIAIEEDWKHYILDKKGNVVIEIDVTTENRGIITVYEDYFVCNTDEGYAIFDYSDTMLIELKRPNYEETVYDNYFMGNDCVYKNTYEKIDEVNNKFIKSERFDGKKFVENKNSQEFEITSKRVATTQSGLGYGVTTKSGETVIPFEYDIIYTYGEYFVAIKYTGSNKSFDQTFDIYDKDYNKTAENLEYGFYYRSEAYGLNCHLPNGYFQVMVENEDYEMVYGIIDYTGKVIVEPVFGRGIRLCTYEGTGAF